MVLVDQFKGGFVKTEEDDGSGERLALRVNPQLHLDLLADQHGDIGAAGAGLAQFEPGRQHGSRKAVK